MRGGVAIGLDIGSSGVRAALVDAAGERLASGGVALAESQRRDFTAWWSGVAQALATLPPRAALSDVQAIAVDGTSGTILAVDAYGAPLGPASLYNDTAAPDAVARVAAVAQDDSAARGATSPLARLLALKDVPAADKIMHQADWIVRRLCGRCVSDGSNALKSGYDPIAQCWPDWLRETGVDPLLLPEVVAPGTDVGRVIDTVADALGLPHGVRVVAGMTDGCAAFFATGADTVGDAVTSLGTTLTLKLLSDRPIFSARYGIYSHLIRGRWLAGGASNSGGGALLQHFSVADMTLLSARIDPMRDTGTDYYPLPAPGERFPIDDPAMVARVNPRPADNAAFLHGLLDGIARVEALGYARLAELGAPKLRSVRSVGGGAGNATWTAIRARRLRVDMPAARSTEAAVGTALLALSALTGT